ncbi:hypothetical protein [Pseudaestuariivita sp.]|uniref:hypothetical protein n=1 Tax=Pseudaestuariivita sp. TaxID=2211669 RepID=UPI004059692A
MRALGVLTIAGLALAGCVPTEGAVQDPPAEAAAPAPVLTPDPTGIQVPALVDCSVGAIGLFGDCEDTSRAVCAGAGLTMARFDKIDPENPGVAGYKTENASIVESGAPVSATHRVICA